MQPYITIFILFASSMVAVGQTNVIAHRSHSGKISTLRLSADDNVGLPPSKLYKVIRLSETSVVTFRSLGSTRKEIDTVYHHEYFCNPQITLDSLKKIYPQIKFIGFKSKDPKTPAARKPNRPVSNSKK